jgi:hypothetical protein
MKGKSEERMELAQETRRSCDVDVIETFSTKLEI